MIHFLLGAAYSGKTTALFELARKITADKARVLFFVPEQQTAAAEADLLRFCSNRAAEYLEVLNFQRLPNRIFREIGGLTTPTADRTQKALFLARLIRSEADALPHFSRHADNPDFLRELGALMEEFSRGGTDADALASLADSPRLASEPLLREKVLESAHLYAAYRRIFSEHFGCEADEEEELFRRLKFEPEEDFFADSTVLIDGFYDFTAPEYDLILYMARHAKDVYLSLLDAEPSGDLFTRSRTARSILQSRLEPGTFEVLHPDDFGLAPRKTPVPRDLSFLCDYLLETPHTAFEGVPEHLELFRAEDPQREVDRALSRIRDLHENEHVAYSDCAIVYRDTQRYAPLVRAGCRRYALPIYSDERLKLSDSPLARYLTAAAALASGKNDAHLLSVLLSSGLSPLSDRDACLFDRYLTTWSLTVEECLSEHEFTASPFGFSETVTRAQEEERDAILADINGAKEALLRPLRALVSDFSQKKDAAGKCGALFDFAVRTDAAEALSRRIDRSRARGDFSAAAEEESLFAACKKALDALAAVPGEITDAEFCTLLELVFSLSAVGVLPSSPEALAAGDVSFVRLKKVRHLFVLGLDAETFPRTEHALNIFSLRERTLLAASAGADPAFFAKPGTDLTLYEYFLFYLAASVPADCLHLSFSRTLPDGKVTEPSVFWQRTEALFPDLSPVPDLKGTLPTTLAEVYDEICDAALSDEDAQELRGVFRAFSEKVLPETESRRKCAQDLTAPADGRESFYISQAKLEIYGKCPYRYFLQYSLLLSEEQRAVRTSSLGGTVVHAALEHLLAPFAEGRGSSPDFLTPERTQAEFRRQFEELCRAGWRPTPLDSLWFSDLAASTEKLVASIGRELGAGKMRPMLFEADLSRDLDPIRLPLKDGTTAVLHGKADRIDLCPDPGEPGRMLARVVDYKNTHLFDLTKVYAGLDTQLFFYLFTLSENGITIGGVHHPVTPAGAYYLRTSDAPAMLSPKDVRKRGQSADETSGSFSRTGIFSSDDLSRAAMLGKEDPGAVSYPITKKGTAKSGGLIADAEEFNVLKDAVLDKTRRVAEKIRAGKFRADPLALGEENTGCKYCRFAAVCRFEGDCRRIAPAPVKAEGFFDLIREGGLYRD